MISVYVLFLAGLSWRIVLTLLSVITISVPFVWFLLHDYQRQRVLTFLNPGRDPLGTGYHMIQSKLLFGRDAFWQGLVERQHNRIYTFCLNIPQILSSLSSVKNSDSPGVLFLSRSIC